MTNYSNSSAFMNESVPKGTPYTTGYTFNSTNTGQAFGPFSNETCWIRNVTLYVQSGVTFSNFRIRYPLLHTSGTLDETATETGFHGLRKYCKPPIVIPHVYSNERYMIESGNHYFKFELNLSKPIHLVYANGDYLYLGFRGLANGQIQALVEEWRTLSTGDEVGD